MITSYQIVTDALRQIRSRIFVHNLFGSLYYRRHAFCSLPVRQFLKSRFQRFIGYNQVVRNHLFHNRKRHRGNTPIPLPTYRNSIDRLPHLCRRSKFRNLLGIPDIRPDIIPNTICPLPGLFR